MPSLEVRNPWTEKSLEKELQKVGEGKKKGKNSLFVNGTRK
jgi:hypothetical protein